jgi:hypothetical protein
LKFQQLQSPHPGGADAVLKAHPGVGLAWLDLVGPQQLANPQPPVVEVVAAQQRGPAFAAFAQAAHSRFISNGSSALKWAG